MRMFFAQNASQSMTGNMRRKKGTAKNQSAFSRNGGTKMNKRKLVNCIMWPIVAMIFTMPFIAAADMNSTITAQEKAQFDKILEPVMKIYHLLLYLVSAVAICYMLYIGIQFILSGGDPKKRDEAKNALTYVCVGLLVVWVAPYVVQMLIG